MSNSDPRSWLDRLVGAALGMLIASVALLLAVRLIEAVWLTLVVIAGVIGVIAGLLAILRRRDRGW